MHALLFVITLVANTKAFRERFHTTRAEAEFESQLKLVDITNLVKSREDVRCCCEEGLSQQSSTARRCVVNFLDDLDWWGPWAKKCRHFPTPSWSRTYHLGHYTHYGSCKVASEDLGPFLERFGTQDGYCSFRHNASGLTSFSKIGEEISDYCSIGYRSLSTPSRCKYADLLHGQFEPPPACTLIEDFCKADEGARFDAHLGQAVTVNCGPRPRHTSTPPQVWCGFVGQRDAVWLPRSDDTNAAVGAGVFTPPPRCNRNGYGGEVRTCKRGVHTYIHFTDGGCFSHIDWDGSFLSQAHEMFYKSKLCPYSQNEVRSRMRRSLFVWYRTLAVRCFFYLDRSQSESDTWFAKYRLRQCPSFDDRILASTIMTKMMAARGDDPDLKVDLALDQYVAPFSLTDLGHSCLSGDPAKFHWRTPLLQAWLDFGFERRPAELAAGQDYTNELASLSSPMELCNTFLQLPIMWEMIGFDKRGLMWEDSIVKSVTSFYGKVYEIGNSRKGDASHCWRRNASRQHTGHAANGRVVLRAVLPTYYAHVYVESMQEVTAYGWWQETNPRKEFDVMRQPLTAVCRAAAGQSHDDLDNILSIPALQWGEMHSAAALQRDTDRCHDSSPCNYNKCNLCKRGSPCFNPVQRRCHPANADGTCGVSSVLEYREGVGVECQGRAVAQCTCHKAICWYFNADFEETFDGMSRIVECHDLLPEKTSQRLA